MELTSLALLGPFPGLDAVPHSPQSAPLGSRTVNSLVKGKVPWPISFAEEEEIINREDVDPSVGKFRNVVSTKVIIMMLL